MTPAIDPERDEDGPDEYDPRLALAIVAIALLVVVLTARCIF